MTMSTATIPQPPKIPGLPIIGCALSTLTGDPRDFLMRQVRELGPIFRLQAFHINYVVMAGTDANQFINVEGRDYFESNTFWSGMMHELEADHFLIGLDGEEHTLLRKKFKFDFSKAALEPHIETLHTLCEGLFDQYHEGDHIAMVEPILSLTSQMIGCVMTGQIPQHKELHDFLYYVNTITNHFNLNRLPAWLLKLRLGRFSKARLSTLAFAENVLASKIHARISGNNPVHNFVDSVLDAAEQCPHLFAHGDQRFSAILPLFAGIDTLGQTLNYALFELHRHPNILEQVQSEIDLAFADGIPSAETLKNMPLLNATIMETLRLHPSAFGMVRTAAQDFVFADHQVKKGDDVVILTTAPHQMAEYFDKPEQFDIRRFMAPRNEHKKRNVFAPFGRGPHTCLGAGMAESMMNLALASILHRYEFEPLDKNKHYKERVNPTPSLGKQFKLCLKKHR